MYDILSLTYSTLLAADMILFCTKNMYLIYYSHSPFHTKNVYSYSCSMPPLSRLTSCTPIKSNLYLDSSVETVIRERALYKLLTFHNSNLISVFHRLGCLSRESVQVRGSFMTFVTIFFTVKGCKPDTQPPQAGGPLLVVCPRLLIHSCSPLLEAVPSSTTRVCAMLR
jgi:hypothetical protein